MAVAYKWRLYVLPEHRPAKFENIGPGQPTRGGLRCPRTSNERRVYSQRAGDGRRIYAARRAKIAAAFALSFGNPAVTPCLICRRWRLVTWEKRPPMRYRWKMSDAATFVAPALLVAYLAVGCLLLWGVRWR
jgi:hypothetical protein